MHERSKLQVVFTHETYSEERNETMQYMLLNNGMSYYRKLTHSHHRTTYGEWIATTVNLQIVLDKKS